MDIFNSIIAELDAYKASINPNNRWREFQAEETPSWPVGSSRDIILKPDLALEFGSPECASVSFVLWTGDDGLVADRRITLIGPDIVETPEEHNPYGKIVIASVKGFDETNAVARNRQIHLKKFDVSLKGYMLRSASQYLAEWNRISRAAVSEGFSFSHLGSALISAYKQLDYLQSAEVLFVTSSNEDVARLHDMGQRSARVIKAMSKMVDEMNYDCSTCSYQEVCSETDALRNLRNQLRKDKERS